MGAASIVFPRVQSTVIIACGVGVISTLRLIRAIYLG